MKVIISSLIYLFGLYSLSIWAMLYVSMALDIPTEKISLICLMAGCVCMITHLVLDDLWRK